MQKLEIYARKTCQYLAYASEVDKKVLRDVCFTDWKLYLRTKFSYMKQKGMRLENKPPREITNMDQKNELERLFWS